MTDVISTLQDFPLHISIQAVKASADFSSYDDFRRYLLDHLPQNSPVTRERYANLIGHRYFPGKSLDNLLTQVWKVYQDEPLLINLMRVAALEAEPVIARFVLDQVWPLSAGQVLDTDLARSFIHETYGEFKQQSYERLLLTMRRLGFLGRYNGKLVVEEISPPADAFLILLHERLAPTPRILRLSDILSTAWWRLLGLKTADTVRHILRHAEASGLVSRYVTVDELEQVTTRFSRDEYIGQTRRL